MGLRQRPFVNTRTFVISKKRSHSYYSQFINEYIHSSRLVTALCICHRSAWWRMCQKPTRFGLNKWLIHSHLSFYKLAWSWTPTRAGKQHYRGKPRWAKQAHKTRIHVTQSAKTETCFYCCNHTINLITQNLLPRVEGNLSQCIAGVHLLINVCILHTKPAKTLRQMEMECSTACACVFRRPTLQHPGCLFLNHLPENHPYRFLLHCRHPHRPAKQRSYPPQGAPKKRRADSYNFFFFVIFILTLLAQNKF